MIRTVQPELLDALPPEHPLALRNRRELRRLNALMRAFSWHLSNLRDCDSRDRILEIGAGRGELANFLLQRIPALQPQNYTGLDVIPRASTWPAVATWIQSPLENIQDFSGYSIVLCNLILHQFQTQLLEKLGPLLLQHAKRIVCVEPRRNPLHLWQIRFSPLIGMGKLTLHDAAVSIRGGFLPGELPHILGLDEDSWSITENTTFFGAYRLSANRK